MQKLNLFLACVATLVFLTGCMNSVALTKESGDKIRGRALTVMVAEPPSFYAMTGGKTFLLGSFQGIAAASHGNSLIKENNVSDPAQEVARSLAQMATARYGLVKAGEYIQVKSDDSSVVIKNNPNADLVLLVSTRAWLTKDMFMKYNNYAVMAGIYAQLLDVPAGKAISQGYCVYDPKYEDRETAPTWDELYSNNAQGLKNHLKMAEAYCANDLAAKTLGL